MRCCPENSVLDSWDYELHDARGGRLRNAGPNQCDLMMVPSVNHDKPRLAEAEASASPVVEAGTLRCDSKQSRFGEAEADRTGDDEVVQHPHADQLKGGTQPFRQGAIVLAWVSGARGMVVREQHRRGVAL